MSKKASNFQKVVMSWGYRGKEIFKPWRRRMHKHTLNSSISIMQIIMNPSPQQQPSMSTHSHFINHTLNLSLKTIISLLNPQNQSLPPFSLIHLIQFNNVIQLISFPHSSSITHHTPSFLSLMVSESSQVF